MWSSSAALPDIPFAFNNTTWQGRNEVRWSSAQEAGLAPPLFEFEVFWKQMYCIEESTSDTVGTFGRHQQLFGAPRSDLASP